MTVVSSVHTCNLVSSFSRMNFFNAVNVFGMVVTTLHKKGYYRYDITHCITSTFLQTHTNTYAIHYDLYRRVDQHNVNEIKLMHILNVTKRFLKHLYNGCMGIIFNIVCTIGFP